MAISRPKNLTIFATLLNFLELNKGVKSTKQENITDMLLQINQFVSFETKVYEKENYLLNEGGMKR